MTKNPKGTWVLRIYEARERGDAKTTSNLVQTAMQEHSDQVLAWINRVPVIDLPFAVAAMLSCADAMCENFPGLREASQEVRESFTTVSMVCKEAEVDPE